MKETPHTSPTPTDVHPDELGRGTDVLDPTEEMSINVEEANLVVGGFADEVKRVEAEQAAATRHEALALGSIDASEAIGDQKMVAGLMEARGYVKRAPRLKEQLADDTRTKPFKFFRKYGNNDGTAGQSTEIKGLRELRDFLTGFIGATADADKPSSKHMTLMDQAADMLENTTFIGEKEYEEAAEGLGMYWKQYLDEDPDRVLCILAEVGELERYKEQGLRKSDHYLRDRILDTFTDEELERYSGRIVGRVGDIRTNPDNAKVVILDDWTISGTQMRSVYGAFADHPSFRRFLSADSLEINLLVGSEGHLQEGLKINPYQDDSPSIKVRSYFMTHPAKHADKEHKAYVSGLHSSVNYDFKIPVQAMAQKLRKIARPLPTPGLIWVVGAYEESQRIQISGDRLVRVGDDGRVTHES